MFHIPSIAINGFMTKHIARKTISFKLLESWWSFYEVVISLKQSTSAPSCNMSKIMIYRKSNIIDQRKESITTYMIWSKCFSLKTFFPWLLMGLNSYLLVEHFRFFIRIPCLSLWARFAFNSFMKTKTRFDGMIPLTTKNILQNIGTILKSQKFILFFLLRYLPQPDIALLFQDTNALWFIQPFFLPPLVF